MNVLMLTPSFHPSVGGVQTHVKRVAEELINKGHAVAVLTRRIERSWPEREKLGGISIVRVPRRGGFVRAWRRTREMMKRADAVHCHDAYSFARYYLPFRLLFRRRPVFITFHGYEGWPIGLQARLLRRMASRLCRGAICIGEFIRKHYGTPCQVVSYGGVDAAPLGGAQRPPERAAVFVGRLAADTGILTYMEALRILRSSRDISLRLDICGDGPLAGEVDRLQRHYDLPVFMHGEVREPAPYLAAGEVAFATGYLSILGAMALGRRVFAVYETPIKEDYLRCFPAADRMVLASSAESLAGELSRYLADPGAASEQVRAAQEFALGQTWEKVADAYLDLYRKAGLPV